MSINLEDFKYLSIEQTSVRYNLYTLFFRVKPKITIFFDIYKMVNYKMSCSSFDSATFLNSLSTFTNRSTKTGSK